MRRIAAELNEVRIAFVGSGFAAQGLVGALKQRAHEQNLAMVWLQVDRHGLSKVDWDDVDLLLLDMGVNTAGTSTLGSQELELLIQTPVVGLLDPGQVPPPVRLTWLRGFLSKNCDPEDALPLVRRAVVGERVLCPFVSDQVVNSLVVRTATDGAGPGGVGGLTRDETQLARHLCSGLTNEEISRCLHLSVPAIKNRISRLQGKFGARNRVQLAALMATNPAVAITPTLESSVHRR